ncbi:formate dehydrogenase subunit gamma [Thiocapsa rosea]|uniref:NADH-quinone oxidoreductase subunit E n=1 Tax=Thiocapsa rosea TaxID=69360 RepID=A0A495VCL0_9GAMM|nr:formate dehydrogenase subunit gamma [Thiocapsa rosea]RKT47136.1 formate dehydrogenase gamma subunit [Thiocapsa rosea]
MPHASAPPDDPTPFNTDAVREVIRAAASVPGAMLPVLHAVQGHLGHIPSEVVPLVAQALNVSRAEVQGVLDFYHDFRRAPPGRHLVWICRAESCQAMGAEAIETHARNHLGLAYHETTADGALTLEPVYCLGNCACSPAVRVDGEIHGRMDPIRFEKLVEELRAETVTA